MTAVDWSKHPEPWRSIGPRFAKEAAKICRGESPALENPLAVTDELIEELVKRHREGLKWKDLAAFTGCTTASVSQIVNGRLITCRYVPKIREWLSSTTSAS